MHGKYVLLSKVSESIILLLDSISSVRIVLFSGSIADIRIEPTGSQVKERPSLRYPTLTSTELLPRVYLLTYVMYNTLKMTWSKLRVPSKRLSKRCTAVTGYTEMKY